VKYDLMKHVGDLQILRQKADELKKADDQVFFFV